MNEEHRRLSGAYAADAVTREERAAHEAVMRDDPEVAEETRSLIEAVAELSKTSAQAPPTRLQTVVLDAIRAVRPLPPLGPTDAPDRSSADRPHHSLDRSRPAPDEDAVDLDQRRKRRRVTWIGAGTAAAAAIVAVVAVLSGQRDLGPIDQAQAVIAATDVRSQEATVDDWSATLYLSEAQDKAVIASEQMPDAPNGNDFQVWLQHEDGSMTSAGVMPRTNGGGQEFVVNGVQDGVVAIAVSVEPAGGSVQPTADPLLIVDVD